MATNETMAASAPTTDAAVLAVAQARRRSTVLAVRFVTSPSPSFQGAATSAARYRTDSNAGPEIKSYRVDPVNVYPLRRYCDVRGKSPPQPAPSRLSGWST